MGTDREQAAAANRARMLSLNAPPSLVPSDVSDDLLRSTLCAKCGYDLNGLPLPAGTCPECGRSYGGPEVCLYGFGSGARQTAWTRPPPTRKQLAWRWGAAIVLLLALLTTWHAAMFLRMYWGWLVSGAISLAIMTWRATTDQPSDAVQVRLTAAGVKQLSRGWGPIPYDRVDRAKLVPWRKVHSVKINQQANGLAQVKIASSDEPWTFQRIYVDALVRCPPESLQALRNHIAKWRADADRR